MFVPRTLQELLCKHIGGWSWFPTENEPELATSKFTWIQLVFWVRVDNDPYSVTFLIGTHIFQWYTVWCGSKNQKAHPCLQGIKLCAQNMITIIGSIINIIKGGGSYDHRRSMKIFHLTIEWDIHLSFEDHTGSGYDLNMKLITILYTLCVSYPRKSRWVRKRNHLRHIYLTLNL
jgi:hypothetical protein